MGTKLGVAKVKISKSSMHIQVQNFLKYLLLPDFEKLPTDIILSLFLWHLI